MHISYAVTSELVGTRTGDIGGLAAAVNRYLVFYLENIQKGYKKTPQPKLRQFFGRNSEDLNLRPFVFYHECSTTELYSVFIKVWQEWRETNRATT